MAAVTVAAASVAAVPGPAAAQGPNPLGTATATAGEVDLDLHLLGGLLGPLHLGGADGLDVPLAGLVLGRASAPTASGDAANFTDSTLRLRDGLISTLHLPGDSVDLIKADAASGTARVVRAPGAYAQAYATVANLRLFLPLVTLPGADASNGFLKIDAVSAQATCVPGQKPTASAKTPATILLLGHQIPVPLSGDVPLDVGVAKVDVHLSPVTTTSSSGAAASVEARISVNAAGLVTAGGAIVLASASCTSPASAGAPAPGGQPPAAGGPSTIGAAGQGALTSGANAAAVPGGVSGGVAGTAGPAAGDRAAADQGTTTAGPNAAPSAGDQDPSASLPLGPAAAQGPMDGSGGLGGLLPALGAVLAAALGSLYVVRLVRRRRAASEASVRGFRARD